jgi:hypothetical protein
VAAGLCFVVMLINYFLANLAGFISSTAFASFSAFMVLALIASLVVYLMTKNSLAAMITAIVLCGGIMLFYGKNASAFEGLFGDILNVKFTDYVNSLRISEACRLLRATDHSVTEIASMAGFGTLRTFNRAFIKRMGVSPSNYRKSNALTDGEPYDIYVL